MGEEDGRAEKRLKNGHFSVDLRKTFDDVTNKHEYWGYTQLKKTKCNNCEQNHADPVCGWLVFSI